MLLRECVWRLTGVSSQLYRVIPTMPVALLRRCCSTQDAQRDSIEVSKNVQCHKLFEKKIAVTKRDQTRLSKRKPYQPPNPHILRVAIIGAPNAGKSTLANQLLGWRFSAVSKKVHTTRRKTLGVLTEGSTQVIFLDTPGITSQEKVKRHRLERSLLIDPHHTLFDADIIMVLADVSNLWERHHLDPEIIRALHLHQDKMSVLVLNKVDLIKRKSELLKVTRLLTEGVVGGQKHWSTTRQKKRKSEIKDMFDRVDIGKYLHMTQSDITNKPISNIEDKTNLDFYESDSSNSISDKEAKIRQEESDHLATFENLGSDKNSSSIPTSIRSSSDDIESSHIQTKRTIHVLESNEAMRENTSVPRSPWNTRIVNLETEEIIESAVGDDCKVEQNPEMSFDCDNQDNIAVRADLSDMSEWRKYRKRLDDVSATIKESHGWGGFDSVFMVSALTGDGVCDMREYLFTVAKPGPWLYHGSLVTDQDPKQIAYDCVWEKMLDHLDKEVPYTIQLKPTVWHTDDDNRLHIEFELLCPKKRYFHHSLGKEGNTIKRIASEARQALMNTFKLEIALKLVVKLQPKASY